MVVVSNPKIPFTSVLTILLTILLLSPCSTRAQSLNWSYQTGGSVYSSPAIGSDGTIYIGSADSYLYALSTVVFDESIGSQDDIFGFGHKFAIE